jgi:hypothetical protein
VIRPEIPVVQLEVSKICQPNLHTRLVARQLLSELPIIKTSKLTSHSDKKSGGNIYGNTDQAIFANGLLKRKLNQSRLHDGKYSFC